MITEGDSDPIIEVVEISLADLDLHMQGMNIPLEVSSSVFDSLSPDLQADILSLIRSIAKRKLRSKAKELTLEELAKRAHVSLPVRSEEDGVLLPWSLDPDEEPE